MTRLELSLGAAWAVCFAVACSSTDNGSSKPPGGASGDGSGATAGAAAGSAGTATGGAGAPNANGGAAGSTSTPGGANSGGASSGGANSGGASGGGAAGAPVVVVERPALVTSAAGAYWKTGTLTPMSGGTATITVDPTSKLQKWIGFGGTFNEAGWDALSVLTQADRDPGAVRVKTTGGNAVSFKNPDGSLVTVLFNSTASAATTTVALGGGTTVQAQVPAQGWATIYWKG